MAARARQREQLGTITYPAVLPITERRYDLLDAIGNHQVVVVAGETGSGKSTQLPKLCLELGRGVDGLIGHTQPRRVAARSIAERVAEELGSPLGDAVGYTVRFNDRVGEQTLVKVMTDGILLAEIQRDRELRRYDTIIVDEAHERSLNIDFLLGYLTTLLPRRPDLKLVVTSATIDTALFSRHFADAPVIEVSGRTYPVELRYRPLTLPGDDDEADAGQERDLITAIGDAVQELGREGPGDVLVFLSGEREIHDAADALRRLELRNTDILPLYARLTAAEQHRVFESHTGRRIVLSTNVAETSLTVPGVRYVVDAGTARISRYSRRLKVQRLPIEAVSRASADQRAGRCGRVAPGVCIRLYDEADYLARDAFTEPEILRTNLASVILQMTALGIGDVASFPFVEPPDHRSVADGYALLDELGALTASDSDVGVGGTSVGPARLTKLGRRLAQLPVDPRLGRMVLEAEARDCVREAMVIAAALSIQDPRERPAAHQQAADELHRRFAGDSSDFLAYVRLWDHLREQQRTLSGNQFRKLCKSEFLNYLRVREWQDLFSQLRQVASTLGLRVSSTAAHPDNVHQALLAGLLSQLGMREGESREFRGARQAKFVIGRGSQLANKPPRWVMVAELVETDRLRARTAARIQPEWAERLAPHLVKRSYGDPVWDDRRATAVVPERVTLYGLPIVANRLVPFERIDPVVARELFVQHALVEPGWSSHHAFLVDNRGLVAELRELEERLRRPDELLVDEALYHAYDRLVPADVASGQRFDRWWRDQSNDERARFTFTRDDLVRPGASGALDLDAFPEAWHQGALELAVTYELRHGSDADGATVHIPLTMLGEVRDEGFDWHVPGLRTELITALVRTLPKPIRRQLVPVAGTAATLATQLDPAVGRLLPALAHAVGPLAMQPVGVGDFDPTTLSDHLRVRFSIDDEHGEPVATGRELGELQERLRGQARQAVAATSPTVERDGLVDWDLGTLAKVIETPRAGHVVRGFPVLVDRGDRVDIRVLSSSGAQERVTARGVRRLLLLTVGPARKAMQASATNELKLALAALGRGTVTELFDECAATTVDGIVAERGGAVWDEASFRTLQSVVRNEMPARAPAVAAAASRVMTAAVAVQRQLAALVAAPIQPAVADARSHLARLTGPGAIVTAGAGRLTDVERYVTGIGRRLDKLAADPAKDRRHLVVVHELEQRQADLLARTTGERRPEIEDVGWLLEELRVSLFAQSLGTARPVSEQRIRKELARLSA